MADQVALCSRLLRSLDIPRVQFIVVEVQACRNFPALDTCSSWRCESVGSTCGMHGKQFVANLCTQVGKVDFAAHVYHGFPDCDNLQSFNEVLPSRYSLGMGDGRCYPDCNVSDYTFGDVVDDAGLQNPVVQGADWSHMVINPDAMGTTALNPPDEHAGILPGKSCGDRC